MGNEQMIWNIIGSMSNSIAAICAVVAIVVTVWNFRSDRKEQTKEKLSVKLRELYKQAVIDSFLKLEDEKIGYINDRLSKMSRGEFDENKLKELSEYMMLGQHDCLREADMVKIFNKKLCREVKQITENIFEKYSTIINSAVKCKFISKNYEYQIRPEWIKLRSSIYECYIEENFDKLNIYSEGDNY